MFAFFQLTKVYIPMKRAAQIFFYIFVFQFAIAQSGQKATRSFSSYFTVAKKYLVLPVKNGAPKKKIEIWVDGIKERYLDIELAENEADWNAYLQIDTWKGKDIELRVNEIAVHSKVFSPIVQSDVDTNANIYREKLRPQFHFSPKRGWNNDPNGMVYFNGEYHLFYQHNPYGRRWGNMTWGHAVTKDLVHWTHLDDALHPDPAGPVFSGGAVVDETNSSGFASLNKPAMVLFHTGAEGWGQYISWSVDGRNFNRVERAVVPRINKDNRDPKVIWHEPTKKWVMVVWVERGDDEQHSMQFLTSPDLKNWTPTSVVMGGKGDDRYLFECPEFFELPVEGLDGVKKWVLTGANTQYAIGTFDGKTFTAEEERLQQQHGRDFYAPQTFSNEPNGRRIEIGWWRTHTDTGEMTFNQSMSIPMELKLVKTPQGIRLTRAPLKELETLRKKTYKIGTTLLQPNGKNPLQDINIELAELRMEIAPERSSEFVLNVRGVPITYNIARQEIKVDGITATTPLQNGKLSLIVYADRTGLEIFVNNGLLFIPVNINLPENNRTLSLSATGGKIKVNNLNVYELKSIWETN
jgi:sucrose-6-phosphate hydrolase SacC (GH32 family)